MKIFEEYKRRHNIKTPIVYYPIFGCLIFKSDHKKWDYPWCVFTINWEVQGAHPGKYILSLKSPLNGKEGQELTSLYKNHFSTDKNWAEYEDYIYDFAQSELGLTPILKEKEVILSAWEIFICAYESWFFKQSFIVKSALFKSIDVDEEIDKRFSAFENFINLDCFVESRIFKTWNNTFLSVVQNNYLNWLGDLYDFF